MPLFEPGRPSVRPRGGVSKVELIPAPEWAGGGSRSASGPIVWAFCEDRAHYGEQTAGDNPLSPLIRHTLEMVLPSTAESRLAVTSLEANRHTGVVATVTLASGERVVAGHSARFGTSYPLRVAAVKFASGHTPADLPTVTLTLESIDADSSENG